MDNPPIPDLHEAIHFAIWRYRKKANDHRFNRDDSVRLYLEPEQYKELELNYMMRMGGPFPDPPRWMGILVITGEWRYTLTPNVITLTGGTNYSPYYPGKIIKGY